MQNYSYRPRSVCSVKITFGIEDGKLHNVRFLGGCPGNLAGISKLVEGMDIDFVIERFAGTTCGPRPTSCPDQLSIALREAYEAQQAANA